MPSAIDQTEIRGRAQVAKEYLIAQIVEQARLENIPLSEIEIKMLHFTESVETLPDIWEVSEQFEKEYVAAEYEAKISSLLKNARMRVRRDVPDGAQKWRQAEKDLRKEDHYLGVMVGQSYASKTSTGDFWPVMKWAGITAAALFSAFYLEDKGWMPNWIKNLSPLEWMLGALVFFLAVIFLQDLTFRDVRSFFNKRSRQ